MAIPEDVVFLVFLVVFEVRRWKFVDVGGKSTTLDDDHSGDDAS
jgi:hypothetical protein